MTDEERKIALYCLKVGSDYHSEVCQECIKFHKCDQNDVTETIIKELEQEGYYKDLAQSYEKTIVKLTEAIAEGQTQKWIPCSKRLPEDYEIVIASVHGDVYPESRYSKEDGWEYAYESGADYWEELDDVVAWMPMPKPYEVKSDDEERSS